MCIYACAHTLNGDDVTCSKGSYTLQGLLETQLAGLPFSSSELLSDYLRLFQASTDATIVKMLQVKLLIPVSYASVCPVYTHTVEAVLTVT